MKIRDSGMPDEAYWSSFFDAPCVMHKLLGAPGCQGHIVEFGCGYGTFSLPAARCTAGNLYAFDIEADLVARLRQKAADASVHNLHAVVRDFVADGTGLPSATQAHAMIYNLLHVERPVDLLKEALRVLQPGGTLSVIHWRSDIPTPRGPALAIRPTPAQCKAWIADAGFHQIQDADISACCPYHFGIVAESKYCDEQDN